MSDDRSPPAYTKEEMRDMFMQHVRFMAQYWATTVTTGTLQERIEGFAHSLLKTIDGCAGGFPCAIDLVLRPHPDDKAFHIREGDKWVQDGMVVNDDCHLHGLFYRTPGPNAPTSK